MELNRFGEVLVVPVSFFFGEDLALDSLDQLALSEFRKLPAVETKQIAVQMVRILLAATIST